MASNPSVNRVKPRVDRMRYVLPASPTLLSMTNPQLMSFSQCTWIKNSSKKPRTEAYIETMHKQLEILRKSNLDVWHYAEYLESQLDDCKQYHHPNVDFRANRPPHPNLLLGQEDDSDFMMGGDDNDQDSDDGNDPMVLAMCIPPQSLQVR